MLLPPLLQRRLLAVLALACTRRSSGMDVTPPAQVLNLQEAFALFPASASNGSTVLLQLVLPNGSSGTLQLLHRPSLNASYTAVASLPLPEAPSPDPYRLLGIDWSLDPARAWLASSTALMEARLPLPPASPHFAQATLPQSEAPGARSPLPPPPPPPPVLAYWGGQVAVGLPAFTSQGAVARGAVALYRSCAANTTGALLADPSDARLGPAWCADGPPLLGSGPHEALPLALAFCGSNCLAMLSSTRGLLVSWRSPGSMAWSDPRRVMLQYASAEAGRGAAPLNSNYLPGTLAYQHPYLLLDVESDRIAAVLPDAEGPNTTWPLLATVQDSRWQSVPTAIFTSHAYWGVLYNRCRLSLFRSVTAKQPLSFLGDLYLHMAIDSFALGDTEVLFAVGNELYLVPLNATTFQLLAPSNAARSTAVEPPLSPSPSQTQAPVTFTGFPTRVQHASIWGLGAAEAVAVGSSFVLLTILLASVLRRRRRSRLAMLHILATSDSVGGPPNLPAPRPCMASVYTRGPGVGWGRAWGLLRPPRV
jgi:hypothetical protein